MVSSAYIMQNPYAYQTAGQSQQPGQYAAYAANSNQALRQSRLFNYCKYKILFNFNILKFVFWNVLSLTTIFPENINNSEAFYFLRNFNNVVRFRIVWSIATFMRFDSVVIFSEIEATVCELFNSLYYHTGQPVPGILRRSLCVTIMLLFI